MHIITLPKQAIYTLHTLSKTLTQLTGYRCKLSRTKDLIHILKLSSLAKHPRIHALYLRFLSQLNVEQLQRLLESGVYIPKKILQTLEQTPWQNALSLAQSKFRAVYTKVRDGLTGSPLLAS